MRFRHERRCRRGALVIALHVCALFGVSRTAHAGAAAKLTYVRGSGAERCANEEELRKAVAARVGYDLFFPWAQKSVVVEVSAARPTGYHGVVQIVDDQGLTLGQRSLDSTSDDCQDLLRAVALAISIAVDDRSLEYIPPPAAAEPAAAPAPESMAPTPPTASELPVEVPPPTAPAAAPSFSFSAWATPLVALQLSPSPAVGGEAAVALRRRDVSLALGIRTDAPASGLTPVGGTVSTWLVAATLAPCLYGPLRFSYCALVELGSFGAQGHVTVPKTQEEFFGMAGGRVGFELPLFGRFFLVSHLDVLAALTRFDVTVNGGPAFRVPPVSGAFGAGLGVVF